MGSGRGKAKRTQTLSASRRPGLDKGKPLVGQVEALRSLADELCGFQHGDLHARLVSGPTPQNQASVKIEGVVEDAQAQQVGRFSMWLEEMEWEGQSVIRMKFAELRLQAPFRGQGFGKAFYKHRIGVARKHGVDLLNIWAIKAGSYAWAREDWFFETDYEPFAREPSLTAQAAEARGVFVRGAAAMQELVGEGTVTAAELDEFRRAFLSDRPWNLGEKKTREEIRGDVLSSVKEIAKWGRGTHTWVDEHGHETWLGKALLLSDKVDWRGYQWL